MPLSITPLSGSHQSQIIIGASLFLATTIGCGNNQSPTREHSATTAPNKTIPATTTPTKSALGTTADSVAVVSPAAKPSLAIAGSKNEAPLVELVRQWNEAILSRNPQALANVYAGDVEYYSRKLSRDQVIKSKMAALQQAKDYTQSLESLHFDGVKTERPRALFKKHWVANSKPGQVEAHLAFRREQSRWFVAEEGDLPSEAQRGRSKNSYSDVCQAAVIKLVLSTKEAQDYLGSRGPSPEYPANSARFESYDYPKPRVALQENNAGYRVTIAWFEVDLTKATVAEDSLGAEGKSVPLRTSEGLQAIAKTVCKR